VSTALRFLLLDVFTDRALTGNQLAVCVGADPLPAELRQDLAREIGFSETVFVEPPSHVTAGDARLRIHTPSVELPFAGHPVLGSAVALAGERGLAAGAVITLECGVGPIPVELGPDGRSGWMRQPVPTISLFEPAAALLDGLGLAAADVVAPLECYVNGPEHIVVTVASPAIVAEARPDLGQVERAAGARGVSVCAVVDSSTVVTRVFGPGLGVAEDPATGSAAGPVGVHLLRHGLVTPGVELVLHQGHAIKRPSVLRVRVEGLPDAIAGVAVGGDAVLVGEAVLRLDP
jgi:trans-2,3-dihydro-3-hydroxyanthranilate isomerase